MKRTMRRLVLPAVLLVGTVTLAACGGNSETSTQSADSSSSISGSMSATATPSADGTPASGPHNAADVTFATGMIPHHGQALEMAAMAVMKATDPQVKQLAVAIQGAQTPEIVQMSGWLSGWGEPVPDPSMSGMGMSGIDMTGMMSEQDMTRLKDATGTKFDRLWLEMMVTHHQGAVAMAKTEQQDGQNSDAKKLAVLIIAGQSKEIATMQGLLQQ